MSKGKQYTQQFKEDAVRYKIKEIYDNSQISGMVNSYSKKGYPWDNACIELFHTLLKKNG